MKTPRKRTVEWTLGITVTVALFAAGLVVLLLTRTETLDTRPWSYVGLALAGSSAVLGMLLAIAEADIASEDRSDHA